MLKPKALDHIALKVTDMDKTLHFYHQLLGLELMRTTGPNAEGGRTAVLKVGSQEINVFSRPHFIPENLENIVGVEHFCLAIDTTSIDALIADLQQVGIDNIRGPKEFSDGVSVFVYDPDGINVELRVETKERL
ncbi:MAG: VOC family protein [Anaerolineae bacterium]|nr:VOC family protein [Anaerolineae bacterium]